MHVMEQILRAQVYAELSGEETPNVVTVAPDVYAEWLRFMEDSGRPVTVEGSGQKHIVYGMELRVSKQYSRGMIHVSREG